ncbi:MAG: AAA family ATPase [Candidatus Thorarchaeota archaeon]
MNNKNFLICLVGLPASGKSTFANLLETALKKKYSFFEVKVIDPDLIRHDLTSNKFEYTKEYLVRNKNLEIIRRELKQGHIVISDDLNYYVSMRHDLKEITDDLNLDLFIVHITTPIECCIKWNEKRGKPIPNEVIQKIKDKFDMFNKYKWDDPIASYNLAEISDLSNVIKDFLVILESQINFRKTKAGKESTKSITNLYNENLDKITRTYVKNLVLNPDFKPFKNEIFKLRRAYIKKNKNKMLSESEVLKSFKLYLKKILNIEFS